MATDSDYIIETEAGTEVETVQQAHKANNLVRVERRNRILSLRRMGFTYDQISAACAKGDEDHEPFEITPRGCQEAVVRYVNSLTKDDTESIEVIRHIENERLERMFKRLEADTHSTNPKVRVGAIRAQIRVMERHARMNGLDAATKVDVSGGIDHRLVADPKHVRAVDEAFRRRHGGGVIELPAASVREG